MSSCLFCTDCLHFLEPHLITDELNEPVQHYARILNADFPINSLSITQIFIFSHEQTLYTQVGKIYRLGPPTQKICGMNHSYQ
jgi:hypothetical protein